MGVFPEHIGTDAASSLQNMHDAFDRFAFGYGALLATFGIPNQRYILTTIRQAGVASPAGLAGQGAAVALRDLG